jgi:hypothetical protein
MRVQVDELIAHPGAHRIDLLECRVYPNAKGGKSF